jgi:hypothetical protein
MEGVQESVMAAAIRIRNVFLRHRRWKGGAFFICPFPSGARLLHVPESYKTQKFVIFLVANLLISGYYLPVNKIRHKRR